MNKVEEIESRRTDVFGCTKAPRLFGPAFLPLIKGTSLYFLL